MKATWALRVANACRLAAGVMLCGAIHQAAAATFVVTTTTDSNDGACTVALCSLRDAIIASNATPGTNVITLPAGTYALTIAGANENLSATGDLDINSNGLTINGAGAASTIVDGGGLDRVFEIHTSPIVFNGLTIRNGQPPANQDGGAILNDGVLTLNDCIVTGNHTTGTGKGGGIWTNNDLTLNNTTVSGNTAGGNGGGIDNEDTVHINTSNISGNAAGAGADGGGIYDAFGALTINDTTVSGNSASGGGRGAGIFENGNGAVISRSTFSANSTNGNGGAFFLNGQPFTLTNVTISGNTAASGGGLFNNGNGLHIVASTIASNTGGGIANNGSADATGTIIANNDTNCTLASITDSGSNLQFPGTTCGLSVTSADPLLQPLASNGGPTQTRAIPANSPAVDANTEVCPPTPPTDQRGVTRPQGPHCDIGAFELAASGLPTLSINNVSANEGNSGTTPFTFTVTLSAASASTVTVNFATADGTATAGSDYVATSGTLTFAPGVTTQTITVNVNGDTIPEANESFFVNLSAPTNATIATGQGTGVIVNDDVIALPTLSINNVSANEGNSGTTPFTFTVTLSAASASTVTVNFATADGTATAGSDYVATSGTLTFAPGVTTQTITVNVNGDTTVEPNETFTVTLSGASNATIAGAVGTGTIVNDDLAPPPANVVIPTLDPRALGLLVLLLAGAAAAGLRRRR